MSEGLHVSARDQGGREAEGVSREVRTGVCEPCAYRHPNSDCASVGCAHGCRGAGDGLLTVAERKVVRQAGDLWGAICGVVADGPTRADDLGELVVHIHAIQHAIMANAAARAYPNEFRTLGRSLTQTTGPTS